MTLTDQDIEQIDEISHEYINWCFEVQGRVPWLTDDERTMVEFALLIPDAEARWNAVLDIIQDIADNLATTDFLADSGHPR